MVENADFLPYKTANQMQDFELKPEKNVFVENKFRQKHKLK